MLPSRDSGRSVRGPDVVNSATAHHILHPTTRSLVVTVIVALWLGLVTTGCAVRVLQHHADPLHRAEAASSLGERPTDGGVEALCGALAGDLDIVVREAAASALWTADTDQSRGCLVEQLEQQNNQCLVAQELSRHIVEAPQIAEVLSPFSRGLNNQACLVDEFVGLGPSAHGVVRAALQDQQGPQSEVAVVACRFGSPLATELHDEIVRETHALGDPRDATAAMKTWYALAHNECATRLEGFVRPLFVDPGTRSAAIHIISDAPREQHILYDLLGEGEACAGLDAAVLYYSLVPSFSGGDIEFFLSLIDAQGSRDCPSLETHDLVA